MTTVAAELGGGLIDGRPGLFRRATMVCHCLLLETATGLVLVETGMGTPAAVDRTAWLGAGFVRQSNPVADPAQTGLYSRYQNPTVDAVEEKLAALERAEEEVAFASGMAALADPLAAVLRSGHRLLAARPTCGSTAGTSSSSPPVRSTWP